MKSMFDGSPWRRATMGVGFFSDIAPWIESGIDIFSKYQEQQLKEAQKDVEEAKAEASRAQAEAAAAEARAKAQPQVQTQAAETGAQLPATMFLGIPMQYVVIGAVGLGVVGLVAALSR